MQSFIRTLRNQPIHQQANCLECPTAFTMEVTNTKAHSMAGQRPTSLPLQIPRLPVNEKSCMVDSTSVISPMTELAMTFQESCKSYSSTPRRRLSLSDYQNTPTPVKQLTKADSVESGICIDFQNDIAESPMMTFIKSRTRKNSNQEFSLRKAAFRRCNSMQATSNGSCLEPLAFRLSEEETSPIKIRRAPSDEKDINAELNSVGLPDELKMTSCRSTNKRSFSAPPGLEPVEKYFEDLESNSPVGSDGFDFIDCDETASDASVPKGMSVLLDGEILNNVKTTTQVRKKSNEEKLRAFPLAEKENVIDENRPIEDMFKRPTQLLRKVQKRSVSFSIKRTDSQIDFSPISSKRTKVRTQSLTNATEPLKPSVKVPLKPSPMRLERSMSAGSPVGLKDDIFGTDDKNLIGDKSKPCCLPLVEKAKHPDLKSISPDTLSKVLDGEFSNVVDETVIVDCRYPYEYKGGHIKTAINVYCKEDIIEEFLKNLKCQPDKRTIVIFHCEFSSMRGPTLCRFLRNKDRDMNRSHYPQLHYPELYLLEGGYKAFFTELEEYCEPQSYLKMVDEKYSQDLKHFAKRSKSWSEGSNRRCGLRY